MSKYYIDLRATLTVELEADDIEDAIAEAQSIALHNPDIEWYATRVLIFDEATDQWEETE